MRPQITVIAVIVIALLAGFFVFSLKKDKNAQPANTAPQTQQQVAAKKQPESNPAPAAQAPVITRKEDSLWAKRCAGQDLKSCEVFQTLVLKQNNMRIAEVAISLPEGHEGSAKMAVILPLGIILSKGITVQVDNNAALKTPLYSCNNAGCLAHITLSPVLTKTMREGKTLNIVFLDSTHKKIKVEMALKGFSQALSEL